MDEGILFCGVASEVLSEQVVEEVLNQIPQKISLYGVYCDSEYSPSLKWNKLISFWDIIKDADYSKYTDYICNPIDEETINMIGRYDMQVMYMCRRCGERFWDLDTCRYYYYNHLKFWNDFLKRYRIAQVVFSTIPHEIYDYIIYILCEFYKIPVVLSDVLSMYDSEDQSRRVFLRSIRYDDSELISSYLEIQSKKDRIELPNGMEKTYDFYVGKTKESDLGKKSIINYSSRGAEVERYYGSSKVNPKNFINNPLNSMWQLVVSLKGKSLTKRLVSFYDSISVEADYSKKYIYVPLQYTPECTSSPQGLDYSDQITMIDVLANSVPDDILLYVREHPVQTPFGRRKSFYERVKKIRNVVLIKEYENTYLLSKNAVAVASLIGSAGYECQYFGVPFIMFGDYISKYAPGTYRVHNYEECRIAIKDILSNPKKWTNADIKKYIYFIYQNSISIKKSHSEDIATEIVKRLRMEI